MERTMTIMLTPRRTKWDAPTIHQLIFAWTIMFFGLIQVTHQPINLEGLPHTGVLFNTPVAVASLALGAVAVFTAFYSDNDWLHYLRVAFCIFNVGFYCALSWIFAASDRLGAIVYPMVMLWSIWLLGRVVLDRRIQVEIIRVIKERNRP